MAGSLHMRNLDDLIARLKRRAARHGRSTEAEHRETLRQALGGDVEPSFDALAADLRKLTKRRKQTPSERGYTLNSVEHAPGWRVYIYPGPYLLHTQPDHVSAITKEEALAKARAIVDHKLSS